MPGTTGIADTQLPTMARAWALVMGVLVVLVLAAALSAGRKDASTSAFAAGEAGPVTGVSPGTTTTVIPDGSCRVTISGGQAELRTDPSPVSNRILAVPAGDYAVSAVRPRAASERRWLQIDVGGTIGWVVDAPVDIKAKSAECA